MVQRCLKHFADQIICAVLVEFLLVTAQIAVLHLNNFKCQNLSGLYVHHFDRIFHFLDFTDDLKVIYLVEMWSSEVLVD